ncbi:hypothetical protein [Microbacterium sp. NPDC079995]|uniref:hypothetical protein n=1 Tax=unclassified Microbacterium TaxID=2609290 RepID=UPI00344CF9DB
MQFTHPQPFVLEDGLHEFTFGGTQVLMDPNDPYESTIAGNAPVLIGYARGPHLLAVETWQAAAAIAHAADSHEYTVLAFTNPEQLARAERVLPPSYSATDITVVLAHPGDVDRNRGNWRRAKAAVSALGQLQGIKPQAVAGTLDAWPEWLDGHPASLSTHLTKRARVKAAQPPAETTKGAVAPVVDWNGSRITLSYAGQEEVLMTAAVKVVASYRVTDDMNLLDAAGNPTQYQLAFDLKVAVGTGPGRREAVVTQVRDEDLDAPRRWLKRVPHSLGTSVIVQPGLNASAHIANAIRLSAAEAPSFEYFARTGWTEWEGRWVYLHAGGAIGAAGETHATKTIFTKNPGYNPLSFPAVADAGAALQHSWDMTKQVTNRAALWAMLGTAVYSVAGLGIGGVPWIWGQHGSGKTVLASVLLSHLSQEWAKRPMTKIDQTVAAGAKIGAGLESGFTVVDDFRRKTNPRAMETQMLLAENLVRRGFERGAAHVGMVRDAATNEWVVPPAEMTAPAIIVVAEILPSIAALGASSAERLLPVEVRKHHIYRDDDYEGLMEKALSPLPAQAMATFIQRVAASLDQDTLVAWQERWAAVRSGLGKRLESDLGVHFGRTARIGALALTGARLWLEMLEQEGVLSASERDAEEASAYLSIKRTLAGHVRANLKDDSPANAILHALRAAVADQRVAEIVSGAKRDPHDAYRPVLIRHITIQKHGSVVAIHPEVALEVLRRTDLAPTDLARELGDIVIKEGSRPMRQVRLSPGEGGKRVRCIVISTAAWAGDDSQEDDAEDADIEDDAVATNVTVAVGAEEDDEHAF